MLRKLLLTAAAFYGTGLAAAVVTTAVGAAASSTLNTVTFVSSTSFSGCSYKLSSGGIPPTPVPASTTTFDTFKTITNSTVTVPPTVVVNAPAVTSTKRTDTVYTWVTDTVTVSEYTSYSQLWKTVATGTFANTVCSAGAKPTTVTEYTGTYQPFKGQETTISATYPTTALCSTGTTYIYTLLPTLVAGEAVTVTTTPTRTLTDYTETFTSTIIDFTTTVYLKTASSTVTLTTYTPAAITTINTVVCPEKTVTRTQDARCAPTNLIGTIFGEGIRSGRYADRVSVVYTREEPWASDYTACCQACLDSPGCGATDSGFGACGLLFHASPEGEPVCNAFILSFTSSPNAFPDQSLVYSAGCGLLEYDGSFP